VMRKSAAVDVSAHPAPHKAMERIRPFGEMLEGSMRPMRAGETEAERREERPDRREERRGQMDQVYGGGLEQKGEPLGPPTRKHKSEDKIQKDSEAKID
jgi:hypothetical protein